jgi:hypothetical protein
VLWNRKKTNATTARASPGCRRQRSSWVSARLP